MIQRIALPAALLIGVVRAQGSGGYADPAGYVGGGFSDTLLCNQTFADANATGIYHFNPNVYQGNGTGARNDNGTTLPVSLAVTLVAGRNSSYQTQFSAWFSSNGADYANDLGLGFDVCGMGLLPLSANVNARGLSDNGSCTAMFDESCVGAIQAAAEKYALQETLLPSPGPASNLTNTVLPTVCANIASMLNQNKPAECAKYFDPATSFLEPTALTGYNSSLVGYDTSCAINQTYYRLQTIFGNNNSAGVYDQFANTVGPFLFVYMPVANAARKSYITRASASMVCAHFYEYNEGSTPVGALPSPTPVGASGNGGLSGGAAGGIVVGVLLLLALVAGLVWFFRLRRRRARQPHMPPSHRFAAGDLSRRTTYASEMDGVNSAVTELPSPHAWPMEVMNSDGHRAELAGSGSKHVEMSGSGSKRAELYGDVRHAVAELEGTPRYKHIHDG